MGLTLSEIKRGLVGDRRAERWEVTFDSAYASGGESLTPADLGLNVIEDITVTQVASAGDGYIVEYDKSAEKLVVYGPDRIASGTVVDDDSAASNGTAVYVAPNAGASLEAHFESTTANNATVLYQLGDGGPKVPVYDNDSPAGVTVHFNDDGSDADKRLVADLSSINGGTDVFVKTSSGQEIRVVHDGSATTTGTDLYIDDDASNEYERFLSVTANDADSTFDTDDEIGAGATSSEVPSGADLSGLVVWVEATGY